MTVSIENSRVAITTMRARLTILGFNLAIITFQISNTRGLGGGTRLEGFATTVHLSTGTVLLIGLALSIAAMVVFIASSMPDREGTCLRGGRCEGRYVEPAGRTFRGWSDLRELCANPGRRRCRVAAVWYFPGQAGCRGRLVQRLGRQVLSRLAISRPNGPPAVAYATAGFR